MTHPIKVPSLIHVKILKTRNGGTRPNVIVASSCAAGVTWRICCHCSGLLLCFTYLFCSMC